MTLRIKGECIQWDIHTSTDREEIMVVMYSYGGSIAHESFVIFSLSKLSVSEIIRCPSDIEYDLLVV